MNGQKRGRGRPSKGSRCLVKGEVPVTLAERFKRDAKERQISQADRLAQILAEVYGTEAGAGADSHEPTAEEGAMQQAS